MIRLRRILFPIAFSKSAESMALSVRGMAERFNATGTVLNVFNLLPEYFVTVPAKVLEEWAAKGFPLPGQDFTYKGKTSDGRSVKPIPYKSLELNKPWENFDIVHELTTKGIRKFVEDYQSTLKKIA